MIIKNMVAEGAVAHILLVDDSPADQLTVERALEDGKVNCRLSIVDNGDKALALLLNRAPYENEARFSRPDLILMDINMPIKNGVQTLKEIRGLPVMNTIPVVMLTTSDASHDVDDCYAAGANAFITKPVNEQGFVNAVQKLDNFWFHLVTLPKA